MEITETSATMQEYEPQQEYLKKMIFLKNRRNNPKYRNSMLNSQKLSIKSFQFLKQLGKGKYGKVYMVKHK